MIESVKLIQFPVFKEDNGELSVFEQSIDGIPFHIGRIFNVRSDKGSVRGQHAHYLCSQLLICSNGSIEVLAIQPVKDFSLSAEPIKFLFSISLA